MISKRINHGLGAVLIGLLVFNPSIASACAVCFGKTDSRLAVGMNWGILTLLFFIVSTLATISTFFVFLNRRAHQNQLPVNNDTDVPTL